MSRWLLLAVLLCYVSHFKCEDTWRDIVERQNLAEELDDEKCDAAAEEEELKKDKLFRLSFLLGTFALALTFICGYFLEKLHIHFIPEAGGGILIGIIIGLIVRFSDVTILQEVLKFDPEFFFVFLLPPIIFEAGYNMKRQAFFRNIGAVCLYSFIGTTVSTFIVGGIVYIVGYWGWCHSLGGLASLVFGALISATDPVTVLAVFQKVHADIDLYSLVFGESVLNDAVAIVLYRTLVIFKCKEVSVGSVFTAFGSFTVIFVGSFVVGTAFALLSALIFKNCSMHTDSEYLFVEFCLLCTFPYMAFMMAEGLRFSGIVSILFCGIGMAHYTYNNLSKDAKHTSRALFKTLATLCETFVFVYLGLAMFSFDLEFSQVKLVGLSLIACLIARLFNVIPCSLLANLGRKPTGKPGKINWRFQLVLWWSGLRGAVAFVIAVTSYSNEDFPHNNDGASILTTTLFLAVITVFIMGGSISYFVSGLDLKEKSMEEEQGAYTEDAPGLMGRDQSKPMTATGLIYLDRKFLKPIFTRYEYQQPQDVGVQDTLLGENDNALA